MSLPKFCDAATAGQLLAGLGRQFAVVRNPAYVCSPIELYPLAPVPALPLPGLTAVVCDMDGTITSTEPVCLHSLEFMVRRASGRLDPAAWPGLDHARDYPHIIGNSTTRHIEYLLGRYGDTFVPQEYAAALLDSALWTILIGRDASRREEARGALALAGWGELEALARAAEWAGPGDAVASLRIRARAWVAAHAAACTLPPEGPERTAHVLRGAIEIYYARYHQILAGVEAGHAGELGTELLHGGDPRLIRPMPGVELFLALAHGLLELDEIEPIVRWSLPRMEWHGHAAEAAPDYTEPARLERLRQAAARWRAQPLRMAVVTSSIRHEADIVLGELFRQIQATIRAWPLAPQRRRTLCEQFAEPGGYYDAIITASDSSEIRLKPHRDLYAIALHRLGVPPHEFGQVLGLEDSESGLIAIRAAGIGLAIAVPFTDTMGHDLSAAAKINYRGLWEVMLEDGWFVA